MSTAASAAGRLKGLLKTSFATSGGATNVLQLEPIPGDPPVPGLVSDTLLSTTFPPVPIGLGNNSTVSSAPPELSTQDKVELFDQVLSEIEQQLPVGAPPAVSAVSPDAIAQSVSTVPVTATPAAPVNPVASDLTTQVAAPLTSPTPQPVPAAVAPQAVPLAVEQSVAAASLNPAYPTSSIKEALPSMVTLEAPSFDLPVGVQSVEHEHSPELGPEIEGFLHKVEDHHEQQPHEIVVADGSQLLPTQKYMAQPVIVLPVTPEVEQEGQSKNTTFSVRWLVEFSHKIMKMFSGKVIYRSN
ncbi:MAG TPA: hypothetical protein VD999_02570 [Vitreimonas sp.]|nr:hypothetical protein [Vitreimonas sp.]